MMKNTTRRTRKDPRRRGQEDVNHEDDERDEVIGMYEDEEGEEDNLGNFGEERWLVWTNLPTPRLSRDATSHS
jgi:hypothetical protein